MFGVLHRHSREVDHNRTTSSMGSTPNLALAHQANNDYRYKVKNQRSYKSYSHGTACSIIVFLSDQPAVNYV